MIELHGLHSVCVVGCCRFVRINAVINPDLLDLEYTKMMVRYRTIQPEGLNFELAFHSREHWDQFASWYKEYRIKKKTLVFPE